MRRTNPNKRPGKPDGHPGIAATVDAPLFPTALTPTRTRITEVVLVIPGCHFARTQTRYILAPPTQSAKATDKPWRVLSLNSPSTGYNTHISAAAQLYCISWPLSGKAVPRRQTSSREPRIPSQKFPVLIYYPVGYNFITGNLVSESLRNPRLNCKVLSGIFLFLKDADI